MDNALFHDAPWHDPLWIDIYPIDGALKKGCLRFHCATTDTHAQGFILTLSQKMERRKVNHHIFIMFPRIILHPPAATLKIHQDKLTTNDPR